LHQIPSLEDQVLLLMSPSERVAQLYLQTWGSLFFTFYDSLCYGWGILNYLLTGWLLWHHFKCKYFTAVYEFFIPVHHVNLGNTIRPRKHCVFNETIRRLQHRKYGVEKRAV
jgi:hypothetical protein